MLFGYGNGPQAIYKCSADNSSTYTVFTHWIEPVFQSLRRLVIPFVDLNEKWKFKFFNENLILPILIWAENMWQLKISKITLHMMCRHKLCDTNEKYMVLVYFPINQQYKTSKRVDLVKNFEGEKIRFNQKLPPLIENWQFGSIQTL